jgi:TetR/AcrR family transcriptional regulator
MNRENFKSDAPTRDRILASAEKEFAEKGFFGARVDEIAHSADINKRMIYAHFGSKEGLYSSVLLEVYRRLADCERRFIKNEEDPMVSIRNIVRISFDFLVENPAFVRMLMWENLNNGASIPSNDLVALKAPGVEYMRAQIRRGKELGVFRKDADETHTVLSLMSFCFSYFSNIHTMSAIFERDLADEKEVASRAEYVADIILKYLTIG